MELDQAIEFAVVSSWEELVKPGEPGSIHVEYNNIAGVPLNSVEVWMIKNRGYGTLVCDYRLPDSSTLPPPIRTPGVNSCGSKTLMSDLDFIMRNQGEFNRPIGGSIHGLVQVDPPGEKQKSDAAVWSKTIRRASPASTGSGV
jgi:hypothetical protein